MNFETFAAVFVVLEGVLFLTKDCTATVQWISCTEETPFQDLPLSGENFFINLTTPASPTNFPTGYVSCRWKVTTPVGYVIRLNFTAMRIGSSDNCSQAFVEITEGGSNGEASLGSYCGDKIPRDVLSSGSLMVITFKSPYGGFSAMLSAEPAETCFLPDGHNLKNNTNIRLKGVKGIFITPKFPHPHPPHLHCRWIIIVPSGYRVRLTFQNFQLGRGPRHQCNSTGMVQVRDSYNDDDPNKAVFCGGSKPGPLYSNGRLLMVMFKSGNAGGSQGFRAHFEAVTEGICSPLDQSIVNIDLTAGASGSISSPDFPLEFPATAGCFWRFTAPRGRRIKLRFTSFHLHSSCRVGNSSGVWIQVDDTFKTDLTEIVSRTRWGRFCGDTLPPTLYSTRNRLQMFFTTNSSQQVANNNRASEPNHGKEGFYVTYEVVEQEYTSRCRTDLSSAGETVLKIKDSSGILVSPGYPYSSPAILCHWKIIVPKQHILELNVQDFELDCQSGSALKISEESEYCGSNKPKPTITSDEDLNIKLTVTVPQFRRGFRAKFSLTKREEEFSSIVPWIIIPLVLLAVGVTIIVAWRRRRRQRSTSIVSMVMDRRLTISELVANEKLPDGRDT